jgi:hypothetical protein
VGLAKKAGHFGDRGVSVKYVYLKHELCVPIRDNVNKFEVKQRFHNLKSYQSTVESTLEITSIMHSYCHKYFLHSKLHLMFVTD